MIEAHQDTHTTVKTFYVAEQDIVLVEPYQRGMKDCSIITTGRNQRYWVDKPAKELKEIIEKNLQLKEVMTYKGYPEKTEDWIRRS